MLSARDHVQQNLISELSKGNMALSSARGKLIGVIGDEVGISGLYWLVFTIHLQNHSFQDTCVGFLLGGIGELDKNRLVLKTSC